MNVCVNTNVQLYGCFGVWEDIGEKHLSYVPLARRFDTETSVSRAWLSVTCGVGAHADCTHDPKTDSNRDSHFHPSNLRVTKTLL